MKMKKNQVVLLLLVSFLGLAGYGVYVKSFSNADAAPAWSPPPTPVAGLTVLPILLPKTLTGVGTIEAVRQVDVASEVSGRIVSIDFQSGQAVKKGDVLVRLNNELDQAELRLLSTRKSLAAKQYARVTKLKGVAVSNSRIDEAFSALEELRAQLASVRISIAKKTITAPFDGVLGIRKINIGQYLNPGSAIVNITDLNAFNVDFKLSESASADIAIGQSVMLTVDAVGQDKLAAVITTIEPQIDRGLHTISVQGRVIEGSNKLRPGLFATVRVNLAQTQRVLMVPETAVERATFGNTLYVIKTKDDGSLVAEQLAVETGRRVDGMVVIRKGLEAQQTVITSGSNRLYVGAAVVLKDPNDTVDLTASPKNQRTTQVD